MSFKIVVFAAAIFASQANAQIGGIIRPFATGFSNGLNEMVKPFVMGPPRDFRPRPQMSQWMSYPSQIVPQGGPYEGFETVASGMPGVAYFQTVRPNPAFKPQIQFYPSQPGFVRPPPPPPPPSPPRPVPAPSESSSSSSSEESGEVYRPSDLLVQPEEVQVPEVPLTAEASLEVPAVENPLPALVEESQ